MGCALGERGERENVVRAATVQSERTARAPSRWMEELLFGLMSIWGCELWVWQGAKWSS